MTTNWSPHARVGAVVAVVAHDKVFIFAKSTFDVGKSRVIDVWLLKQYSIGISFVVDVDLTIADFNGFTRGSNNTFDKRDSNILWPLEDNNITTVWRAETIRNLVDDNILVVVEVGFHGWARDVEGLDKEEADHEGHTKDGGDCFEDIVNKQRSSNDDC